MRPEGPQRILVIEDDHEVAAGMVRGLRHAGFEVELCTDGEAGRNAALRSTHHAIVLDLMLPGLDGTQVLEALRTRGATPVFVVSARHALESRLEVFDRGAIDFVPKPFWMDELVARIRARLGAPPPPGRVLTRGPLELDLDARRATRAGQPVALTRVEFDLLVFLAEREGRALSRRELARVLADADGDHRTIDSHVARLRKKLAAAGACVETVWGIGYRFSTDTETP